MSDIKNNGKNKIAVIGGDLRQLSAAGELLGLGYTVSVCGFDTYGEYKSEMLHTAVRDAYAVLLPIPVTRSGDNINMPFGSEKLTTDALPAMLGKSTEYVFGGMIPDELRAGLEEKGIEVFDFCLDDKFNILNSIPTAEGAVAIAMGNMQITINGASAVVIGFGKIGKTLCRILNSLGADVTAVARSGKDLALAEVYGYTPTDYSGFCTAAADADVIFNTVPHTVINEDVLAVIKKDAFIIDLASRPGGVDCGAALRLGVRVISALSLPGKVAPVTAGRIIAKCTAERLGGAML